MLGIILIVPPRLSETFIAIELDEFERQGVDFRAFALHAGTGVEPTDPGDGNDSGAASSAGDERSNGDASGAGDDDRAAGGATSGWRARLEAPAAGRLARWREQARAHVVIMSDNPRAWRRLVWRKVLKRSVLRLVHAARSSEPLSWSHLREFQQAVWLAARCRALGIGHLHAHYASGPATVAQLAGELTGIPMSFTAHAKDVYASSRNRLARKIRAAQFVVGCSASIAEEMKQLAPDATDRLHTIRHGLSPSAQEAARPRPSAAAGFSNRDASPAAVTPPLVLAAGRLVEKKGFDLLLRAFALLERRGVACSVEIVGEGRCENDLRRLAEKLELDGRLVLRGALPHARLVERYGAARIFVMPSRVLAGGNRDGIPNVVIEAMACGVPVVATAVGGIPEVVRDERNGLLVGEEDAEALAAAIEELVTDPERCRRLGEAACLDVREQFDLARNVGALADLLRRHDALPPADVSGARQSRRPLRVGYLVKRYPRLSETFVMREIIEQERQGTRVHIFSLKKPDEGRFHAELARVRAGVTYLPGYILPNLGRVLGANLRRFMRSPGRYLAAVGLALQGGDRHPRRAFLKASLVAEEVEARKLEHLHAHFATGATYMAMLVSTLTGIPFSFTAHARDIFGHHICRRALRRKIERAAGVVAVSEYTRTLLCSMLESALAERVVMIHNGMAPELRDAAAPPWRHARTPLVLGVGRLVPKKGFADLIEAAARLRAGGTPLRLAIVGKGPERRALVARARELGVPVYWLGALPHDRTVRAMGAATVVVLPARVAANGDRDVLPTVLLEAQALGRPVVSTRVTGIPEIIAEDASGHVVEPGDVEALASAIGGLLGDPDRARRMGQHGRRRIATLFRIERSVQRLRQLFARAADRAPAGVAGAELLPAGDAGADGAGAPASPASNRSASNRSASDRSASDGSASSGSGADGAAGAAGAAHGREPSADPLSRAS